MLRTCNLSTSGLRLISSQGTGPAILDIIPPLFEPEMGAEERGSEVLTPTLHSESKVLNEREALRPLSSLRTQMR